MAVNNFKPFGVGKAANVSTQADYEALPALDSGFSAGKASSAQINKALRQGTVMSSVLAQFIANLSGKDVLDDGNTQAVLNNLIAALKANGSKDFLQAANSLAEIKAAGPDAVASALANLGLGEAAKRSVGTEVGQIPDMSLFPSQLGDDAGWWKLPNGLIEQYMTIKLTKENISASTISYQERSKNVVFPISFSKKCLGVNITKTDMYGALIETSWTGIPSNNTVMAFTGGYVIPDVGGGVPDQDLFVYLRLWGY